MIIFGYLQAKYGKPAEELQIVNRTIHASKKTRNTNKIIYFWKSSL